MGVRARAARVTREAADERLLVEAAQKDPVKFGELYELHFATVYAYISRRVQNRTTTEDLTSEVFHKVYVPDSDSMYERAIQAGATSLHEMADQPYGDREGSVKDKFGNHWYIGTPKGWTLAKGVRIVPYLHLRGAEKMIPFLRDAFGAEVSGDVARSPEGAVVHATIRMGDATLELGEAHGEFQPMPCHLHLYVPDADVTYERALRAGATSISPPENKPYGERGAGVRDPFGNSWFIATYGAKARES